MTNESKALEAVEKILNSKKISKKVKKIGEKYRCNIKLRHRIATEEVPSDEEQIREVIRKIKRHFINKSDFDSAAAWRDLEKQTMDKAEFTITYPKESGSEEIQKKLDETVEEFKRKTKDES